MASGPTANGENIELVSDILKKFKSDYNLHTKSSKLKAIDVLRIDTRQEFDTGDVVARFKLQLVLEDPFEEDIILSLKIKNMENSWSIIEVKELCDNIEIVLDRALSSSKVSKFCGE